jgi:acyl-homoserine lactone acylase PvdQ
MRLLNLNIRAFKKNRLLAITLDALITVGVVGCTNSAYLDGSETSVAVESCRGGSACGESIIAKAISNPRADITIAQAAPGQVAIFRDDWGVPHLYASREIDGYYGLGYAQAEDQLGVILRLFLGVSGKTAAVFGTDSGGLFPIPPAQVDLIALQWDHVKEARDGFNRLSPELQMDMTQYIAGIKRYMSENPEKVPAWAPDLQPWHVVGLYRSLMWHTMIGDGLQDCKNAGVQLSVALEDFAKNPLLQASNEWLLAPSRTRDHSTIVLSDPHGAISNGSLFYEFRMDAGAFKVSGYLFGGQPIIGHNRHVAWALTNGGSDVSDCYELTINPSEPSQYQMEDGWHTLVSKTFTIEVKGSAPITRTFDYATINGITASVVGRSNTKAYVVVSPYMHAAGIGDEVGYRMSRSRNTAEFREALRTMGMFPQNIMAGDDQGHLYYLRAGRTPIRNAGIDTLKPIAAADPKGKWLGIHSLEDMVQVSDPPQGYMQNNNVSPSHLVAGDAPLIDRSKYPLYTLNDDPVFLNSRAARALEVLSAPVQFTLTDAAGLALDEVWYGANAWTSALVDSLNAHADELTDETAEFQRVAQRLREFNGEANASSIAALNHYYWRSAVLESLSDSDYVSLVDCMTQQRPLPTALSLALVVAVRKAVETMLSLYGSVDLAYGEIFRIGAPDGLTWPLGGGLSAMPSPGRTCNQYERKGYGCGGTLRAFSTGPIAGGGKHAVLYGSRALQLVAFTQPLQSYSLHNFGQSVDPTSVHFDDQAKLLSSPRKLKSTYFNAAKLADHVVSLTLLNTGIQ